MPRWTGTWLTGLASAGVVRPGADAPRGAAYGLPEYGAGSVAGLGARTGAFAVDAIASALVARLLFPITGSASVSDGLAPVVVLAVVYLVGLVLLGQTPGMRLLRLRVVALRSPSGPVPLVPAALRTALLLLLVPALIGDRDGRGLHDKAAGTVVVRT